MKREWQYLHGTGLLAQLTYLLLETYLAMVVDSVSHWWYLQLIVTDTNLIPIPWYWHRYHASIGTSPVKSQSV